MGFKNKPKQDFISNLFHAFIKKDIDKLLSFYSETAIFADPHYDPPIMIGKQEIRKGLIIAFTHIKNSNFSILNHFQNGNTHVIETKTSHLLFSGQNLKFKQVIIIDTQNNLITCQRCYSFNPPLTVYFLFLHLKNWLKTQFLTNPIAAL